MNRLDEKQGAEPRLGVRNQGQIGFSGKPSSVSDGDGWEEGAEL